MPAGHVIPIEQLGPAMQALLNRVLPMLYAELRNEVARSVFVQLVDLSPVGDPSQDLHPGKYRASHVPSAGAIKTRVLPDMPAYPIPGDEAIDAVTRSAPPNVAIYVANAAASEGQPGSYAGLLEGGRRMYSRVGSRKAQWVGSTQAPEGIYGPAVRAILALRATIESRAVAKVKERI